MVITMVLPTKDRRSGFWAVTERQGFDAQSVWAMTSAALAAVFALTPTEIRDFLDGQAGPLLAEDLPFIDGGPADVEAIEALIRARLADTGWQRLYGQAIAIARGTKRTPNNKSPHRRNSHSKVRPPSHNRPE